MSSGDHHGKKIEIKSLDDVPEGLRPKLTLEGEGEFKCGMHSFRTRDVVEWDNHCYKLRSEHTLTGEAPCTHCGHRVPFTNLPYPRFYMTGIEVDEEHNVIRRRPIRCPAMCKDCANEARGVHGDT